MLNACDDNIYCGDCKGLHFIHGNHVNYLGANHATCTLAIDPWKPLGHSLSKKANATSCPPQTRMNLRFMIYAGGISMKYMRERNKKSSLNHHQVSN